MSDVVIRSLNNAITLFSRPFKRSGLVEIGVRMCAIKLQSSNDTTTTQGTDNNTNTSTTASSSTSTNNSPNDLLIYNPTKCDAETVTALDNLLKPNGQIQFIVAPSLAHHLSLDEFAAKYGTSPNTKIIGPSGLQAKHPHLKFALELNDNDGYATEFQNMLKQYTNDIEVSYLPDYVHKEIVLFHRPTHTLFVSDLIGNLPAREQYSKSDKQVGSFTGILQSMADKHMNPDSAASSFFAKHLATQKNSQQFKQQIRRIVEEWKPEVIVPQHGDVIQHNGTEVVKKIFGFALQ